MRSHRPPRTRGAGYVREWSSGALHAVAIKMDGMRRGEDLSPSQEWLFDNIVAELEFRRRRTRPVWRCCSCWLCVPPFED